MLIITLLIESVPIKIERFRFLLFTQQFLEESFKNLYLKLALFKSEEFADRPIFTENRISVPAKINLRFFHIGGNGILLTDLVF